MIQTTLPYKDMVLHQYTKNKDIRSTMSYEEFETKMVEYIRLSSPEFDDTLREQYNENGNVTNMVGFEEFRAMVIEGVVQELQN